MVTELWRQRLWPWLFFSLLAVAIAFPWFLEPGYLFLLDFVWTEAHWAYTEFLHGGFLTSVPPEWFFMLLTRVLPPPFVQKIAFTLPLVLSGVAMTHLVTWLLQGSGQTRRLPALTAGVFYVFNSFVTTRVFMGQYYLLLGYALTPWALLAVLRFRERPSPRAALTAGLWITGTILMNAHHLVLLALLLLPFLFPIRLLPRSPRSWSLLLAPLAIFLLASALTFRTGTASLLDHRGPWARALQAPVTGNLIADSLLLTATWKANLPYVFPHEVLPAFGALTGVLLAIILLGILGNASTTTHRTVVWQLLAVTALAGALAIGVAHPLTEPAAAFLYRHVPFWIGMRDSAKFLALVALTESVFLGYGLASLLRASPRSPWHRRALRAGSVLTIAALAVLVLPALGGYSGQIAARDYPESWTAWNQRLGAHGSRPKMLFLPWHQYLAFSFTDDRTVANPAPRFFTGAEVVAGDNSEVGGIGKTPFIYSESTRPISKVIEAILRDAPERPDFGARLAQEHIRYVALATDTEDVDAYGFLARQDELQRVFESPELPVWEIVPNNP